MDIVFAFGVIEGRGQCASERWVILFRLGEMRSKSGHEAHCPGLARDSRLRLVKCGVWSFADGINGPVGLPSAAAAAAASSSHDSAMSSSRQSAPRSTAAAALLGRLRHFPRSCMVKPSFSSPEKSRNCTSSHATALPSSIWNSIFNDWRCRLPFSPYIVR